MMRLTGHATTRKESQELMWDAMEVIYDDPSKARQLCNKALSIYPDCTDAITMLAEIQPNITVDDYVGRLREAVAAGRRDLGSTFFKENRGWFWGLIETRPFMRAMSLLAGALIEWGTPEGVNEAIEVYEEMLELNPDDNQGIRDWLVGCYLSCKRYDDTAALFERYPDDWLAAPTWARVLHAYATEGEDSVSGFLAEARERNPFVEDYLSGKTRRPKARAGAYSPGDKSEAVYCADLLWDAWKKHPKAKKWLKEASVTGA